MLGLSMGPRLKLANNNQRAIRFELDLIRNVRGITILDPTALCNAGDRRSRGDSETVKAWHDFIDFSSTQEYRHCCERNVRNERNACLADRCESSLDNLINVRSSYPSVCA